MKLSKTWVAAAAILALCGTAQAALVSQGDGTVLDTNTNLVWLQNWNMNDVANWSTQKAWAEGLSFAGSTNWEMPAISQYQSLDFNYGDLRQVSEFTNVAASGFYWSSTEKADQNYAFAFSPRFRSTNAGPGGSKVGSAYATAVHAYVAAPIPEPQTYVMMALGLAAMGGFVARRRKQDQAA